MFGALRKKKANLQQADQSAHPQDGTSVHDSKYRSPAISPEDQATLDMMRNKAHSRHPHSKDGEEAAFHAASIGQHRYVPGDEEEPEDGLEEEEDDDDDDLFKFMPPPEITENTSHPHKQSSAPSVPSGALLPAHQVTPQHQDPLQTATTVSTMNTDDIVAIPHIPQMHTRNIETPPSVPHTAGASSWEHTSPAKHDQNARPRTAAEQLTDAQRVVREYQSSQHSATSKRSDTPTDQHASQAVTDNISHSQGAQKRRQPYQYPGSPVYSTTPGTISTAINAVGNAESNGRQRQPSSMTVSYPPEYGLHPENAYVSDTTAHSQGYSKHFVDIARNDSRGQSGFRAPQTPQTVRHRMSKTYSEHDESKASMYRNTGGLGNWSGPQTPGSKHEYMGDYGLNRPSSGFEGKGGGIGIESRDGHLRYPTSGRFATEDGMDSTAVGSTPGMDGGKDFQQFELEDEEDSPYPEVRASVSNIDDPEMPCTTFRALFLGFLFCIIGGGMNFFLAIRVPAPFISPLIVQIVSYPFGKFLAYILPTATHKTPRFLTFFGLPAEWSLNPGPFNIKEHTIIVIMVNVAIAPSYALQFTLTLDKYYGLPKGMAFDWLALITCNCIGFSFAGLCRRYLVWPASMIWPQNLVTCTLFNTFHAEDDDGSDGSLTRYRFFTYVFIGSALWYILPGFLFTALSAFSFICWMAPRAKVANQLFGVATGLGMSIFTFDWSQISYIGSPLIVPWWAEVNVFVGFVILYWIVVPALYYTNTWNFGYMPISTSANFDRWGQLYNLTRVITAQTTLDEAGYESYSMLFMSTTYITVYALSFTLSTAAIVHTVLYNGKEIYMKFKNTHTEMEDVHAKLMRNYPEVPDWWYWAIFVVFASIGIATIEIYETQLPVWLFLLSLAVAGAYVIPGGYIFALTAQMITVNLVAETIPGYALPGRPIANILFKTISVQCLQSALFFVQDLKIGHYMKIPPRVCFMVQLMGTLVACVSQLGVKRAMEKLVPDLCTPTQAAGLNCAVSGVMYEASVIWGLIGPERFFGPSSPYHALLYFTILGALLPIPIWFLQKRHPRSWVKYVNIPVLVNGATFIPPATGINYSSWFIVGFIFQFLLRRFRFRWWSKFGFITSAGLEGGTIIAAIIIFFTLQFPMSGRLQPVWWGNEVYKKTGDWEGVTLLTAPVEGFGPATWS